MFHLRFVCVDPAWVFELVHFFQRFPTRHPYISCAYCVSLQCVSGTELVDRIIFNNPSNGFPKICFLLRRQSSECSALVEDLVEELHLERGDVTPRTEFIERASYIVHRSTVLMFCSFLDRVLSPSLDALVSSTTMLLVALLELLS